MDNNIVQILIGNGATDGLVRVLLGMPSDFVNNLLSGSNVNFYLTTTTNSAVGFTFHSHNFVDPTQWPFLEITAVPTVRITTLAKLIESLRSAAPEGGKKEEAQQEGRK